ncbi:STAS domain-containing protein [Rossellomorea vietnamensis]|uniref:STAS domain-containing protein n=1 Tax=Rossellomorea vietnamensis TaxID=218284 RepID=UPI002078FC0D|nr:STAS domain-containing protein [Rossellomorea vietnamensis]
MNVNTAYVTKRGKTAMTVLSSFNEKEEIIPEGYSVEYGGTYCRLIISSGESALNTIDLTEDLLTKELEVTSQLNVKGFMGVTLYDHEGNVFGTLCVMDRDRREFSANDKDYLKSMAEVLSHVIHLDQTQFSLGFLNVPIIPITKGISVISIQGIIDDSRASKITHDVLAYGTRNDADCFIIDLSGLVILDGVFPDVLADLAASLQLMGIDIILTGVTPEIAKYEGNNRSLQSPSIIKTATLESALEHIGFYLIEK